MAGTGPQLDGARPGDVDGGPAPRGEADGLVAPSLLLRLLLGGVMLLRRAAAAPAAPAATATPAAALAVAVVFGAGVVPSARLWWRLGGGGECGSWRWRAASQGEFLQGHVVLHLQEGEEGASAPQ
jgi:hypothetical protein